MAYVAIMLIVGVFVTKTFEGMITYRTSNEDATMLSVVATCLIILIGVGLYVPFFGVG